MERRKEEDFDSREEFLRWKGCLGKKHFVSRTYAKKYIKRKNLQNKNTYRCPNCGGIHIATKKKISG